MSNPDNRPSIVDTGLGRGFSLTHHLIPRTPEVSPAAEQLSQDDPKTQEAPEAERTVEVLPVTEAALLDLYKEAAIKACDAAPLELQIQRSATHAPLKDHLDGAMKAHEDFLKDPEGEINPQDTDACFALAISGYMRVLRLATPAR